MRDTLILLLILIIAFAIYWPIMRIARRDLAERNQAGLGNGVVYAILLLPLFGPIIYLLLRNRFRVK
ncbi:hypothetical protein [Lewinella sp. W8]|uniref:hypothetical protein n=1 Tax=Lewinella sp. W8 TaxID=2528208 RepID=UPI001067DF74|nr:hypothetical protein [Lewinella sp. W8]MTB50561.1 hypothetical protein [Lewinella sp. W8]